MAGKRMGRPPIEIDKKQFEKLCGLQCTLVEIASYFNCSEDTIERWCKKTYSATFAETFKKKSGNGKISLRRAQFRLAETNASMAIWLGKQYLGQRDLLKGDQNDENLAQHDDGFIDALKAEVADVWQE